MALLFLQGCTTLSNGLLLSVPPDYQLTTAKEEGIVIFSGQFLATGCPGESKISTALISILGVGGAAGGGPIYLRSPFLAVAPEDPNRQLYVRLLKAGSYALGDVSYAYTTFAGGSGTNRTARMPFKVEPGQAYYLGEVTVTARDCRTLDVSVLNQRQRDMRWLARRLAIKPEAVRDQLLQITDVL